MLVRLCEGIGENAQADPGVSLRHLYMRGPRGEAASCAAALRLLRRILIRPLELVLPAGYLLPQSPHHKLAPAQIPHLQATTQPPELTCLKESSCHMCVTAYSFYQNDLRLQSIRLHGGK